MPNSCLSLPFPNPLGKANPKQKSVESNKPVPPCLPLHLTQRQPPCPILYWFMQCRIIFVCWSCKYSKPTSTQRTTTIILHNIVCSTFGTDVSWTWPLIIPSPPSPSYSSYRRMSPSMKSPLGTTSTMLPKTLSPSRPVLSTISGYHAQEIGYHSICLGTIMGVLLERIPAFVIILQGWQCGNNFLQYIWKQVKEFSWGVIKSTIATTHTQYHTVWSNTMTKTPSFQTMQHYSHLSTMVLWQQHLPSHDTTPLSELYGERYQASRMSDSFCGCGVGRSLIYMSNSPFLLSGGHVEGNTEDII